MADKEVNITYETLFEILRREKSREELQELQESFFEDVVEYLKDKTRIMEANKEKLFSEEEKEKTRVQLANIRRILKELYKRREKKIISMALNKSRTKSSLIDTSVLLKEEKSFYEALIRVLDSFRDSILANILDRKAPETAKIRPEMAYNGSETTGKPESPNITAEPKELKKDTISFKKTKTIRFLKPIPKFTGPDLQVYGPFEEDDIAKLPEEAADILIKKQRAEALESKMETQTI